ncbi:type VII secretion-associated serine protease mycosin [Sinosporangium album]|uniref:Type VII secretion-associated serine protease mycosin n=1 Tax=Sinosporangium album TaxID=504805 RepID=A0A1G7YYB7_9ACTN|nr:type VII secretion-associated serine protease mycosin [Sinosporangium album]
MIVAGALALAVTASPVAVASASARVAAPECAPDRGSLTTGAAPWAQQRIDIKSAWRLTMGEGTTIAVIDSGVDVSHPQLKIAGKADFSRTDHRDCTGHGTAVAGIVGAQYQEGAPFHGVAPAARILSLKHTNARTGDLAHLVEAIRYAARIKVDVMNISVQARDQPDLKAAIDYALAQDIVVVAAAGNVDKEDGTPGPAYPAAYEGVLSVGALAPDGGVAMFSNVDSKVSVVAPGEGLTSTWPGRTYHNDLPGTSFAAPYVTGVAALVRSRFPGMTQAQIRRRIEVTADGAIGEGSGGGVINPLYAVTAVLPDEQVVVAPPRAAPLPPSAVTKVTPPDERAIAVSLAVGGGALALAAAMVVGRVVRSANGGRGRRPAHRT